jgi:hypothetical protein
MTITSHHTNACFEAWMTCENFLSSLHQTQKSISRKITEALDECAMICMGTFNALRAGSVNINNIALLCVGICEECAELCESEQDSSLQHLAKTCRQCSDTMSHIAFPAAIVLPVQGIPVKG